ncbi:MAG: transketolase C-terminal domain-containing protein, partial [Candidatus Margulisiibacteriota bacterium]
HAKDVKRPILVHIVTRKGKGYAPAEKNPTLFHSAPPFNLVTGEPIKENGRPTYTSVFGRTMIKMARTDNQVLAISAAMQEGTGLQDFAQEFPKRFFDVGIAEGHAATFAAGLSKCGFKPVVAVYSTFLQRAYDHILHDCALQNLPVVLAIDRAGIVGEDGSTHNGCFDIAYLRSIPNLTVLAPKDENELQHMLFTAVNHQGGPIAVRYPRGRGYGVELDKELKVLLIGKGEIVYKSEMPNSKIQISNQSQVPKSQNIICIIALGSMVHPAVEAAKILENEGVLVTVVNARFAKPLDGELIMREAKDARLVVTIEEGTLAGGFGSAVLEFLVAKGMSVPVTRLGIPDRFIPHGSRDKILDLCGLSVNKIVEHIKGVAC